MTPWEFREALWKLRWKQREAAQYLGAPGGQAAISQWATGARPIPRWVPEAIRTHVALKEAREEIRRLSAIETTYSEELLNLRRRIRGGNR